jgi:hypothetical protein
VEISDNMPERCSNFHSVRPVAPEMASIVPTVVDTFRAVI